MRLSTSLPFAVDALLQPDDTMVAVKRNIHENMTASSYRVCRMLVQRALEKKKTFQKLIRHACLPGRGSTDDCEHCWHIVRAFLTETEPPLCKDKLCVYFRLMGLPSGAYILKQGSQCLAGGVKDVTRLNLPPMFLCHGSRGNTSNTSVQAQTHAQLCQ